MLPIVRIRIVSLPLGDSAQDSADSVSRFRRARQFNIEVTGVPAFAIDIGYSACEDRRTPLILQLGIQLAAGRPAHFAQGMGCAIDPGKCVFDVLTLYR